MSALKFSGFAVGQVIRAEDFEPHPGRGICFIEGPILAVHSGSDNPRRYAHYVIRVTRDVFAGDDCGGRRGDLGYVPMQCLFRDWDTRVQLVTQEKPL